MNNTDPLFLMPDSVKWDPYSSHFAENEESMIDDDVNMHNKRLGTHHIIDMNVSTDTDVYETVVDRSSLSSFCVCAHDVNENTNYNNK